MRSRWSFLVGGYYGPKAKPPKVPGELAIEVGHMTRHGAETELEILEAREDIGETYMTEVQP